MDATTASNHPWMKSYPPLHKQNYDARQTAKRQNTRLRLHSNVNNGAATPLHRLNSKQGQSFEDDESSLMSDSTWNNYMKHKAASPLYSKRQRMSSDGNIVLPFTGGGFHANTITKDAILDDNGSTMSPSNIDSVLATEDSNSQVSSQFGAMQLYYYKNMMAAQTPAEKQKARQEYLDYTKANELKLPLQLPISMGGGNSVTGVNGGGMILPKMGSLKERKISVHDQFENIEEESEDGLESKGGMGLTKLDRMYGANPGYTNSVVSGASLKSTLIPVEISNASYIEKVGVWLNDSKDGGSGASRSAGSRGKYTFDEDKYKILPAGGRTSSERSNMTTSDHSQASSFNRVTLPMTNRRGTNGIGSFRSSNGSGVGILNKSKVNPLQHHASSDLHSQSFISNATSTTELLSASSVVGTTPSVAPSSTYRGNNHLMTETNLMNDVIRPGGGSFNSAASYQPLITK